jgi:putative hydrolase of the HAD superfamily
MRQLGVVFFDVDDTLVDFETSNVAVFRQLFGELDFGSWSALTAELYPRFTAGEMDFVTMRDIRMRRFLQQIGRPAQAADVVEAERHRIELLDASYLLFDDVLPCIEALRAAGLRLGLITNNESEHQRRKLATTGLADLFDAVVISGEVGIAKPELGIFSHACGLLAVEPEICVHIGDNVDTDVRGALGAGIGAIWLDRRGATTDQVDEIRSLGADVIASLSELAPILLAPADAGSALECQRGVR